MELEHKTYWKRSTEDGSWPSRPTDALDKALDDIKEYSEGKTIILFDTAQGRHCRVLVTSSPPLVELIDASMSMWHTPKKLSMRRLKKFYRLVKAAW